MSRMEAEKAVRQMLLSGYRHHSYTEEQEHLGLFFTGAHTVDWFVRTSLHVYIDLYADVLGPQRMRADKNGFICILTLLSRKAIEYGINPELSFAVSDYYINEVEGRSSEEQLVVLLREALEYYYDLASQERARKTGNYSRPVALALRYIGQNLFRPCTVAEAAARGKVSPQHLSRCFTRELGLSPARYIRQRKMAEAERMLERAGLTVAETADALGYCDTAHFSNLFKKHFGRRPSALRKGPPVETR
jgi:AraC-like DNA-binding protein